VASWAGFTEVEEAALARITDQAQLTTYVQVRSKALAARTDSDWKFLQANMEGDRDRLFAVFTRVTEEETLCDVATRLRGHPRFAWFAAERLTDEQLLFRLYTAVGGPTILGRISDQELLKEASRGGKVQEAADRVTDQKFLKNAFIDHGTRSKNLTDATLLEIVRDRRASRDLRARAALAIKDVSLTGAFWAEILKTDWGLKWFPRECFPPNAVRDARDAYDAARAILDVIAPSQRLLADLVERNLHTDIRELALARLTDPETLESLRYLYNGADMDLFRLIIGKLDGDALRRVENRLRESPDKRNRDNAEIVRSHRKAAARASRGGPRRWLRRGAPGRRS
jgi:hypothetical protein